LPDKSNGERARTIEEQEEGTTVGQVEQEKGTTVGQVEQEEGAIEGQVGQQSTTKRKGNQDCV